MSSNKLVDLTKEEAGDPDVTKEILKTLRSFRNEFKSEIQELKNQNSKFIKKINELDAKIVAVDKKQVKLHQEVEILHSKVNCLEQKELLKDILITGLPELAGKQTKDSVVQYLQILDKQFDSTSIEFVYRFKSATHPETNTKIILPIVVRFNNYDTKKGLLNKQKVAGPVLQNQFNGNKTNTKKIIIQQRLTHINYQLLINTRDLKHKAGYKFCWVSESCCIFLQKDEKSRAVKIGSLQELHRVQESLELSSQGASGSTSVNTS